MKIHSRLNTTKNITVAKVGYKYAMASTSTSIQSRGNLMASTSTSTAKNLMASSSTSTATKLMASTIQVQVPREKMMASTIQVQVPQQN